MILIRELKYHLRSGEDDPLLLLIFLYVTPYDINTCIIYYSYLYKCPYGRQKHFASLTFLCSVLRRYYKNIYIFATHIFNIAFSYLKINIIIYYSYRINLFHVMCSV